MRKKVDKARNIEEKIVIGRMVGPALQLSNMVNQIALEANVEQIKELMKLGFDIPNTLAPCFNGPKLYADRLPQYFPFENSKYHISYALKYVLMKQSKNRELVEFIYR